MDSIIKVLGEYDSFLDNVFEELNKLKVDTSSFKIDHICYRVETINRYNELKYQLSTISTLLSEQLINGRYICIFELDKPISYKNYSISCVELPEPKKEQKYEEGFEHIEFVILTTLKKFEEKYNYLNLNTKNINDARNPDISLTLDSNTSVKFHLKHIKNIVLEDKKKLVD